MRRLALAALLLVTPAFAAEDEPAWATGSWAAGSWAVGSWGDGEATSAAVPNVVGEADFAAADAVLEGVGLDGGTETEVCSAAADNEIVGQSIAAGTIVALDTLVNLRSSNGTPCPDGGGADVILRRLR